MEKGRIEFNDPTFREHPQKGLKPLTIEEKREQVRRANPSAVRFGTLADDIIRELTADRDKWRDRCERLVKALDIAGKRCQDVHHSAKHRHGDDEDCLAAQSIYEAIQLYHDAVCESVDQQIQKEIDDDTTRTS